MNRKRLFFILPLLALASCSGESVSTSSSRPYSGPRYDSSSSSSSMSHEESSRSSSSSSSQASSINAKRQKAYDVLATIQEYQESSSFVAPENCYTGSGTAKISSLTAELAFGLDKDNEYFHVNVSAGSLSYDYWLYKKTTTSFRKTYSYIYEVSSLTKTYTKTDYEEGLFQEKLDESTLFSAVKGIAEDMYSYQVGIDMLDDLGSRYSEESITSEKYVYGEDGDISATIKVNDGDKNDFTETFAYSEYLGTSMSKKGTVAGSSSNANTSLEFDYCDTSDTPNLWDYTENED